MPVLGTWQSGLSRHPAKVLGLTPRAGSNPAVPAMDKETENLQRVLAYLVADKDWVFVPFVALVEQKSIEVRYGANGLFISSKQTTGSPKCRYCQSELTSDVCKNCGGRYE